MVRNTRKKSNFPAGWDEQRIRKVLAHYENQTDEQAAREDEAALGRPSMTVMKIPRRLVPAVRKLLALAKQSI